MVRLSCSVSLGTNFYRSPKRNCRGVSMGVDLGLAFCPGAMGLDTSGHRAPGRRIGLGSSPWFPGVSLPSCAKPNKLLNNHECWVLFLKGHEEEVPYCFARSSVKFQGRTALKIVKFDPDWAFPDCNSSLNSPMGTKWCTKLEVA